MPSTLSAGDVQVIGYNSGQSDGTASHTTVDSIQIVLQHAVTDQTVFYLTDRAWSGSSFSANGSDGTITYTVSGNQPAGTVFNLSIGGGFDIESSGDTIYVYQGTDANTPTTFLSAIEVADGNNTFSGNLANTGLTVGVNAVAVSYDSATYSGPTTEAGSLLANGVSLERSIADFTNWVGDDTDAGGAAALDQPNSSGPYGTSADFTLIAGLAGGGGGIASVSGDGTVNGGNSGINVAQLYTNLLSSGVNVFYGIKDVVFDTVHGKFFIADSDGLGGHNRVLQGNISDFLGNPTSIPALTTLYSDSATALSAQISRLDVDPNSGTVYFTHGQTLGKVAYNTSNQAITTLANFGTGSGNPNGSTNNYIDDFVVNYATGDVYLSSHRVTAAQDGDQVSRNYVYHITGLDSSDGAGAFTFANGGISVLPFSPDDDDFNNGITFAAGEGFPQEYGSVEGLALSADGHTLYIAAARTLYDDNGDGGTGSNGGTAPILTPGGIYSYNLTSGANPTGIIGIVYQPIDDGNDGSAAINTANGPQGLLDDLEYDPVTGDLFFIDYTGDQNGTTNNPGDEGIWRIDTDGSPDATFFQALYNVNGNPPSSIFINHAPIVTSSTENAVTTTETNGAGSGASNAVQPFSNIQITDPDSADQTDQLAGAVVRITSGFQSGAGHQDSLTINGLTTGNVGGINFSYDASTGVMLLTGANTFDAYEAAIALVRFSVSGDNPTAYGTDNARTVSWSVSDGLNMSDEKSATVTVTGVNDAPVNNVGSAASATEDGSAFAITGISVSDVDANPASQNVTVTLTVAHGTLSVANNISGGLTAGNITGSGTGTVTLVGTQNAINATLAGLNGLTYTPTGDYNGADQLTVATNDGGLNGTGGAQTDTDIKTINIAEVNDAPTVGGDGTEIAPGIAEDTPATTATASTVATLFAGQFADTTDVQYNAATNPTGSTGDSFAGIAVTGNDSSGSTGQWQYWNGSSWVDIGARSSANALIIAADTQLRFNPAQDYNGNVPLLTAHLVETGSSAVITGTSGNLSVTGGTSQISTGTVTLGGTISAVNDAPLFTNLDNNAHFTEGGAAVVLDSNATVHDVELSQTNYAGATLTLERAGGSNSADVFGGTGSLSFDSGTGHVLLGAVDIGTYTQVSGTLVISFNANADETAVDSVLQQLTYTNTSDDPPTSVTISYDLADGNTGAQGSGTSLSASGAVIVSITPVDDAPVAFNDAGGTDEAHTATGNLFDDNGSGADYDVDGPALAVIEVNGSAMNVGTQIVLPSGALLTVNSDGTYSYDPNHVFDSLPSAASGGSNFQATDTFTYSTGGNTATVTVTINGLDSDDTVLGTSGADTISGGIGVNTMSYADAGNAVTVSLAKQGQAQDTGGAGIDTLSNFQNLTGSNYDDTLTGDAGANVINGGAGSDRMYGGAGNDTYYVDRTADRVFETAGNGTDLVYASASFSLAGQYIENLTLTGSGNINGTGNSLDNVLTGNAGINVLAGGAGDDTYYVQNTGDRVRESAGGGNDTVYSSVTFSVAGQYVETLRLTGTADIDGVGNSLDNLMVGNDGINHLSGGTGNDTYIVQNTGDVVIERANEGIDTVQSSVSYSLMGQYIENLTLTGSAAIDGVGNGLDNVLTGNVAANTLAGGAGNDTYYVSAGDTVLEADGQGHDIVYSDVNFSLIGQFVEDLVLTGLVATAAGGNSLDNHITGNTLANTLVGGDGNDVLDGGLGADTMQGGMGDDTFIVDDLGDVAIEADGQGTDTVQSSVSYSLLGQYIENLVLTGSASNNADGNLLSNTLTGNDGDNRLTGRAGDDTLSAGGGNDKLYGGSGLDTMTGGTGSDSFYFDSALDAVHNVGTITDFEVGVDHIMLDHSVFTALIPVGPLGAGQFVTGTTPMDATDKILYDSTTGYLYYDADGNGTGSDAIHFATVTPGLALTASDFTII